jgi:hypothetical protein
MKEAEERSPEPSSSGQRRTPRPPIRVAGAMADGFPDRNGSPKGRSRPLSPEQIKQIEKCITWPTLKAFRKVAAALRRSVSG